MDEHIARALVISIVAALTILVIGGILNICTPGG